MNNSFKNSAFWVLVGAFLVMSIKAYTPNAFRAYDPPSTSSMISRNLNSWTQFNPNRGGIVSYDITVNASATLLAGTAGQLILETGVSTDGGVTVTVDPNPVAVVATGYNSGIVFPGGPQTMKVSGPVSQGKYFRIRTAAVSGFTNTPTYTNPYTGAANQAYGWEIYNQ